MAREPDFRDLTDMVAASSADTARRNLAARLPDGLWLDWAARVVTAFTVEAVIAWLDAGSPDPDQAAERIADAVHGIIESARA